MSTVSVRLASDANDEIKMSSKLNAESIGDWACTMANGIWERLCGEREKEGGREKGRPPLFCTLCGYSPWVLSCYWSHSPIRHQMNTGLLALKGSSRISAKDERIS